MKQLTVLVALAGALTGCYGPIKSTRDILDADEMVETARKAGAPEKAPYEWLAATSYLRQARLEVAYSHYGSGVDFAEKASACAKEAFNISVSENPPNEPNLDSGCYPAEYRKELRDKMQKQ